MKERPILFSALMVQAILEGRKTQTRRVIKKSIGWDSNWRVSHEGNGSFCMRAGTQYSIPYFKCPYGQVGEILWVRETWAPIMDINGSKPLPGAYCYKEEVGEMPVDWKWKPSIHMPKEACRLKLRITNIRVERLQDITEKDAINEGVLIGEGIGKGSSCWYDYESELFSFTNPKSSFKSLWQSINGKESWKYNPWIWVIEFKVI